VDVDYDGNRARSGIDVVGGVQVSELTVRECDGCALVDAATGRCTSFVDPAYQHRDGRMCWGRCDTGEEMVRRLEAIVKYNPRSKLARHELEAWIGVGAAR
jgi:hypothetical protein